MITKSRKEIVVCCLQVVLMPNGEIICDGKTIGWIKQFGRFLTPEKDHAQ